MCGDENGASHAVRYVNAQLAVLHQNARQCLAEHDQARNDENKHFSALAEFSVLKAGTSELAFQATFDKPQLDFICDHDAILHITIEYGRLLLDGLRPGRTGQYVDIPERLSVSYRLGFETRKIVGNDAKVGEYTSMIQLIILDLQKATFLSMEPELTVGREYFFRYLSQYLDYLCEAGHHVLFSLPQFDRNAPMPIDYSIMRATQYLVGDIHGVTAEQINSYVSSSWLKSALIAHSHGTQSTADWSTHVLADFNTWSMGHTNYGHFRAKMRPPHVDILCSKEVIVQYNIEELEFYNSEDAPIHQRLPVRRFRDWKIAMVVNVCYSSESDNQVVNIAFDSSRARLHETASDYPDLEDDDELGNEFWKLVVTFFADEYVQILESAQYHTIYSRDTRWESCKVTANEDANGGWWLLEDTDTSGSSSRETIRGTRMHGFDQVVAISQDSINAQLATLETDFQSVFHRWSFEQYFSASFKPMTLRLLSCDRAIVWVHLQGGQLKTLRDWLPSDGSTQYEFGEWSVAFEVPLKMCSHEELEGGSSEAFKKSSAFQDHGNRQDRQLKHIYLDLRNAEFLHDYSTISDQLCGGDYRSSTTKLQAMVYYLTQYYFPVICKDGQNVISSVPVWKAGKSLPSYALTNAAFQVYSKVDVSRHNWAHVPPGLEPILVVFGMSGFRPMPAERLEYSTGWIVQGSKGFSHGTISISQRVFIEGRLLDLLSCVNALTTLIPTTPDTFQAFHGLRLQAWAEHEKRKDRPSRWELEPSEGEGCLKYVWDHCEEWRYKMRGSSSASSASQGVSCITRNYVELPTAVKQGALRIKIGGKVDLNLSLQTTQSYTASSSVCWSTHITVQTVGSGIKVDTLGSHDPIFSSAEYSDGAAAKFRNPAEMLREAFPAKINLDELIREIHAFEGAWQYCYPLAHTLSLASPIFNDAGDLLFELRRQGPVIAVARLPVPAAPIATHGGRSSPAPRRIGRPRTPIGNPRSPNVRSPSPRSPSRPPGSVISVQVVPVAPHAVRVGEHVSIVNGKTAASMLGFGLNLDGI